DYCTDGPDYCNGYGGDFGLWMRSRFSEAGRNGNIIRNNVFVNTYGAAVAFTNQNFPTSNLPATPPMILNNTFIVEGDRNYQTGTNASVTVNILDGDGWASSGAHAIIKNNIFYRKTASATGSSVFHIASGSLTDTEIDYNNWGGVNVSWAVGAGQPIT